MNNIRKNKNKKILKYFAIIIFFIILYLLQNKKRYLFYFIKLNKNNVVSDDVLYLISVNLIIVLIILILFFIFRNLAKLIFERKQGVFGSSLRSRLVISLVFFALVPTIVMFYVATNFINISFDRWFSKEVTSVIEQTGKIGRIVFQEDQLRLKSLAKIALSKVHIRFPTEIFDRQNYRIYANIPRGFSKEHGLSSINIYNRYGRLIWSSEKHRDSNWSFAKSSIMEFYDQFMKAKKRDVMSVVDDTEDRDTVFGIAPIYDKYQEIFLGVLVTEKRHETQILKSFDIIYQDFAALHPSAQLLRTNFMIFMIFMALVIVFSAIWLGFYVAREITGPIQNLAEATKEVALGNYQVSLDAERNDETGRLVELFNLMTKDLQSHKNVIENSNQKLHKINQTLEQKSHYLAIILNSVTTGVVSVDSTGMISSINPAAKRLLSIHVMTNFMDVMRELLGSRVFQDDWLPIVEQLKEKGSVRSQLQLNLNHQNYVLAVEASQIADEKGTKLGYVVVFDDVSERAQIQRVAAWREVARRIAHEIKNPITPIKLNAQRLLRRFQNRFQDQDQQVFSSCLKTILTQVDSLRDLVSEFSKFSRMPRINLSVCSIQEVLNESIKLFQLSYPDVSFKSIVDQEISEIHIDKEQMGRVFVNLIKNSLASFENETIEKKIIFLVKNIKNLQIIHVEIIDNGCGIPEDDKKKVFDPYFSTKKKGSGLGLAIANQIVSEHSGYMRIADHLPKGTKVIIEIPIQDLSKKI